MDLGLAGKTVLITGGSAGIGFAIAKAFLNEGSKVVIVARDPTKLKSAIGELRKTAADRISAKSLDLSKRGAAAALADEYCETDILINNAGAIPTGDIFEVDEDRWREAWDLKVFGYVNLTRAMYKHMRGHPPKVICNVIGMGAEKPQWNYVCGNAANIALNGFTRSVGGRSMDDGIRVVGVNPGGVDTERWRGIHMTRAERVLGDATRWRELFKDEPQHRVAMPEQIADVVLYLSSDRASWICGEVVNVDAGRMFRG